MSIKFLVAALGMCVAQTASAQRPDSTARADSIARARADSIARADSLLLMREVERIRAEPRARVTDTTQTSSSGPTNARLLPDISAVGDFVADLSPDSLTTESGKRVDVREVEIAVQAAVDPYFRGDIFLGISDAEGIAIEQAFLTATALPWGLEARIGRFLMPFGKQNTTHRHDLHTVDYPYAIQEFFGPEGFKGTGLMVSKLFAPFGFYQEVQLTAVDQLAVEEETPLTLAEPVNRRLSGLGYSARLRNYWDISQAANVELAFSGVTGKRAFAVLGPNCPIEMLCSAVPDADGNVRGAAARQSVIGADFTYRWRPLQQGLYKSFILQAEVMQQRNPDDPTVSGLLNGESLDGRDDLLGYYAFARYQLSRRLYLGGRYDGIGSSNSDDKLAAASAYLEFFPSEFSKLIAGYEARMPTGWGNGTVHRILLQATFALGPHKPHPF
jgi:hypothetical protein